MTGFSSEAMLLLKQHSWPGNVRELKNMVERLVIMIDESEANSSEVSYALSGQTRVMTTSIPKTAEELKKTRREITQRIMEDIERGFVLEALGRTGWNVTKAAADVGLLRPNFHALMRKHRIGRD